MATQFEIVLREYEGDTISQENIHSIHNSLDDAKTVASNMVKDRDDLKSNHPDTVFDQPYENILFCWMTIMPTDNDEYILVRKVENE